MISANHAFFEKCDRIVDIRGKAPVLGVAELFIDAGVEAVEGWEKWRKGKRESSRGLYIANQKKLRYGLGAVAIGASIGELHAAITTGEFSPSIFVEKVDEKLKNTPWRMHNPKWFERLGTEVIPQALLLQMAKEADIDPTLTTHLKTPALQPRLFNRMLSETNINTYISSLLDQYSDLAWQIVYQKPLDFVDRRSQVRYMDGIDSLIWDIEDRIDDRVYEEYMDAQLDHLANERPTQQGVRDIFTFHPIHLSDSDILSEL